MNDLIFPVGVTVFSIGSAVILLWSCVKDKFPTIRRLNTFRGVFYWIAGILISAGILLQLVGLILLN